MPHWTRRAFLGACAPLLAASRPGRKGSRFPAETVRFSDPLTERLMWRLTNPAALHHLPHYHHRFISRNNSFLLLASERSGTRQILKMDLPEGEMVQLTEGPGIHSHSPSLGPRDRWFLLAQGNTLKQVTVKNGREREIYRAPRGWQLTGHLGMSDDGRYAALIEMKSGHHVDGFEEQFEKRPQCRLMLVELKSQKGRVLAEENHWLAHPQFRPGGTEILYAHEGPWGKVDGRLRLVGLGGGTPRNLRPRQGSEGLGHEYWSAGGGRIYYVFYPDDSGRNATIRYLDFKSGREHVLSPCTSFGWLNRNSDDSAIVGASQRLSGPNIYILFPRLKREITVCEHVSSGRPYPIAGTERRDDRASFPEPAFSSDSQWVYFTSDKEGLPAVYRVNVSDLVEPT